MFCYTAYMENPFSRLLNRQQSPNDIEGCDSYIDPEILDTMTPEGRDMIRRRFEESDLIHTITNRKPRSQGNHAVDE